MWLGIKNVIMANHMTEFVKCVKHDQQNLCRFFYGLTQNWYFAIEN